LDHEFISETEVENDTSSFDEIITTGSEEPDENELELMKTTAEAENKLIEIEKIEPANTKTTEHGIKLEVVNESSSRPAGDISIEDILPPESKKPVLPEISLLDINQSSLTDFSPDEKMSVRIIADTREFNSNVAKRLAQSNVKIEALQLGAGDYILSERVAVERKRTEDLLESLIDGRLFVQLKKLKALYLNPILIIEGKNLFSDKNINPSALSGALASIVTDFRIPIINTKNERETVKLLIAIARREQADKKSHYGLRTDKSSFSEQEQKQFIIEGLPNISAVLAQRLLSHFGTIKKIFEASEEELCEVKGVGKKTAEEIRKVIDDKYQ
jgi:ERCC4-type nuclease